MIDKFSWLHVSDFHFRAGADTFSQDVSCDAVLRDVPTRLTAEFPLKFIVVTGDIAFSGNSGEYDHAAKFVDALTITLGVDRRRVLVVPGNHDVDRTCYPYTYDGVRTGLINQQSVDAFLGHNVERTLLMERQSAFRVFKNWLSDSDPGEETDDGLACVRLLDVDGFRISVLELNSAWLSGHKDEAGSLLIGERQIINALNLTDKHRAHLTVALTHHPPDWLAEFDRLSFINRLIPRLNVFHSGHLHQHQAQMLISPGGTQCLHSAAGSSHESRHYRNAYNLLEYDIGNAVCTIRQFEYDPDSGQFREMEDTKHPMRSTVSFKTTASDIARALREGIPQTEPYADYMAGLLKEDLDEVPISLTGARVTLGSKRLPQEFQFPEVQEFLRISNLIRTYDEIPLNELISGHETTISTFAGILSRSSSADPEFARTLLDRCALAQKIAGSNISDDSLYQVQYLDDLAATGSPSQLADAAVRYQQSLFEPVRIAANRHLALALLQSGESELRQKGLELAFRNLGRSGALARDYVVAAAAAESFRDYDRAEKTALVALDHWPEDIQLREYCRSLITQTASEELRRRLDETGVNGQ